MNINPKRSSRTQPRHRAGWRLFRHPRKVAAAATAIALLGSAFAAVTTVGPAVAASQAYGYEGGGSGGGAGWMGSVLMSDGSLAYCSDPVGNFPSGTTTDQGLITSYTGTTAATWPGHNDTKGISDPAVMQKLNYVITKYGQTRDNNVDAAVAYYVYDYVDMGYDIGNSYGVDATAFMHKRVPSSQWAAVQALHDAYAADANANAATGGGAVNLSASNANWNQSTGSGTITWNVTGGASTATATLTNGTFSDGTTTKTVSNGETDTIVGKPADSEGTGYDITWTLTATSTGAYAANLRLWSTSSPAYAQRDLGPGSMDSGGTYTANGDLFGPVSDAFDPIVTTSAPKSVAVGSAYTDALTASVASGSAPWRKLGDGSYLPILAEGTAYSTGSTPPTESATVPTSATQVATATVTLNGPGTYTATSATTATTAGYITWVWKIVGADQPALTQFYMDPSYTWTDNFGQAAETTATPMNITAVTKVAAAQIAAGGSVDDSITVSVSGAWLDDSTGAPLPVVLRRNAYWLPSSSTNSSPAAALDASTAGAVTPSATAPAGATLISTATTTVTGPTTLNPDGLGAVTAPVGMGHVVFQWVIQQADQSAASKGYVADWSDQFGVADETTAVVLPIVTTKASAVREDGTLADTSTVTGYVPAGAYQTFDGYLRPTGSSTPVCTTATLVSDGSTTKIATNAGENLGVDYVGQGYIPHGYVTVDWINTLYTSSGAVIAQGQCGAAGESSTASVGSVNTTADQTVTVKSSAHDTANLSGYFGPATTIGYQGYFRPAGNTTPTCTADQLVIDSTGAPQQITEGYHADSIQGPAVTTSKVGSIDWVETVVSGGVTVHTGACGATGETTVVKKKSIGAAGAAVGAGGTVLPAPQTSPLLWIGGGIAGAAFIGFIAIIVIMTRRRRTDDSEV